MASKTEIANAALILMGASTISSIDEANKRARNIKARFDMLRKAVLRAHPWKFAHARTGLTSTGSVPALEFNYSMNLPVDFISIYRTQYTNSRWRVEGKTLLTDDAAPVQIVYIKDVEDTTLFDDLFVEALAARIASDVSYSITNDRELAKELWMLYREKVAEARSIDSQQQSQEEQTESSWLNSRQQT